MHAVPFVMELTVALVVGWVIGRRKGYEEGALDGARPGVAGKLECPSCERLEDELRFALDDLEAERQRYNAVHRELDAMKHGGERG